MQKTNLTHYITNNIFLKSFFLLAALFLIVPFSASAHIGVPTQLVPCGWAGTPCNVCHLYNLAHNIIDLLLWGIATPLLVVALLAAGFYWLTSGGSEEKISKGKSILFSAVVGFVIAFGAWVIINTIMDTLEFKLPFKGTAWTDTSFCSTSPFVADTGGTDTGTGTGGTGTGGGTGGTGTGGTGTGGAGTLSDTQARAQLTAAATCGSGPCITENSQICSVTCFNNVQQSTINEVISLQQQCNCSIIVTAGTEAGHSETGVCTHTNGCKVDLSGNSSTLNNTIMSYTPRTPTFGVAQYVHNGVVYTREPNGSWDVCMSGC